MRSQDTWVLVCPVPIPEHSASQIQRKVLERLAIHILKSKAWMVKEQMAVQYANKPTATMGLGFGGIQEKGAAMLAQGNDNGMAESPGNITK